MTGPRISRAGVPALALLVTLCLWSAPAVAQLVKAAPRSAIVVPFPAGVPPIAAEVKLELVVEASGHVESAVAVARSPRDAPDALVRAAIAAVESAEFVPSSRDGRPIRSRIDYVVVFRPPAESAGASSPPPPPPASASASAEPVEGAAVVVRGSTWASPRGVGDIRVDREVLTASPRQQTSEMLSAIPGFFVDHEDGEGLGNDVYLRGFDLDNGSGIEMKVGGIPVNVPLHVRGQGYADVNFVIPEVVESVRALEGPYDPRQGDAAIVGSALFELGVAERGYQLKGTYGSFGQTRLVGIAAPAGASDETFAAFALRQTNGFGQDRASKSATVNAGYGVDLNGAEHLRLLATAYGVRAELPGVVREDDVSAGRIGYYDAYPHFNAFYPAHCDSPACAEPAQGVASARVVLGAELTHVTPARTAFALEPWFMWTRFLSRQNYTGALDSSNLQPDLPSLGDLWQLTNRETAGGVTAHAHAAQRRVGRLLELGTETGVSVRFGHTDQRKDLVNPATLSPWDYRERFGLDTLDLAAYVDLDARAWKTLRVSGGARVDFLAVGIDDELAGVRPPSATGALPGSRSTVAGVAPSPRVTVAYEALPELTPVFSAGMGFRSLDAASLVACNAAGVARSAQLRPCVRGSPYSQVTSWELGLRSSLGDGRFTTRLAAFQTDVGNELVFAADSGGLETERASTRRGLVGSLLARPAPWLLASTAWTVQTATFDTLVAGSSHYVTNVPAILWRTDVSAHGALLRLSEAPLTARVGAGYTLLAGRHVNDRIVGAPDHVVNALASIRYRFVEVGLDSYNLLDLKYPDQAQYYVSNWSSSPGQQRASSAVHLSAAAPRTVLATLALYLP